MDSRSATLHPSCSHRSYYAPFLLTFDLTSWNPMLISWGSRQRDWASKFGTSNFTLTSSFGKNRPDFWNPNSGTLTWNRLPQNGLYCSMKTWAMIKEQTRAINKHWNSNQSGPVSRQRDHQAWISAHLTVLFRHPSPALFNSARSSVEVLVNETATFEIRHF